MNVSVSDINLKKPESATANDKNNFVYYNST